MALPPQFRKDKDEAAQDGGGSNISVSEALDALEAKADSPRAKAAIKTLRSELEGDEGNQSSRPGSTTDAKAQALERLRSNR